MQLNIEKGWKKLIGKELDSTYVQEIFDFLKQESKSGKSIYPQEKDIFNAFHLTSLGKTKVVIIGQDPYHGEGQAHGLSFSVQDGTKIPPSLKNIYKELSLEYDDFIIPESGNLTHWAKQGVLLLNSILTVEASKAGSHRKIGWEKFTNNLISQLSRHTTGLVFVLWGNYAISKNNLINTNKHFILESAHPSPLSAHRGFLGNGHFRKINEILTEQGKESINWSEYN